MDMRTAINILMFIIFLSAPVNFVMAEPSHPNSAKTNPASMAGSSQLNENELHQAHANLIDKSGNRYRLDEPLTIILVAAIIILILIGYSLYHIVRRSEQNMLEKIKGIEERINGLSIGVINGNVNIRQECNSAIEKLDRKYNEVIQSLQKQADTIVNNGLGEINTSKGQCLVMIDDFRSIMDIEIPIFAECPTPSSLLESARKDMMISGDEKKIYRWRAISKLEALARNNFRGYDPSPKLFLNAAVFAVEIKQHELEKELLFRASEASGNDPKFLSAYSSCLARQGLGGDALDAFKKISMQDILGSDEIAHRYVDVLVEASNVVELNRFTSENNIIQSKKYPKTMRSYARYLLKNSQNKEAINILEQVVTIDPGNCLAWRYLARSFFECHNYGTALSCSWHAIAHAREHFPYLPGHFQVMAKIYRTMGKNDDATKAEKASELAGRPSDYSTKWARIGEIYNVDFKDDDPRLGSISRRVVATLRKDTERDN